MVIFRAAEDGQQLLKPFFRAHFPGRIRWNESRKDAAEDTLDRGQTVVQEDRLLAGKHRK